MDGRSNAHEYPPRVPNAGELFSLSQPRSDTERYANEYVDSPNKAVRKLSTEKKLLDAASSKAPKSKIDGDFLTKQPRLDDVDWVPLKKPISSTTCAIHGTKHGGVEEEEKSWKSSVRHSTSPANSRKKNSPAGIICPECGECRCAACLSPRELPKTMICNDRVELSADSVVDALSCMCVVKSTLYHCTHLRANDDVVKDEDAEEPCSCSGSHACAIWTCMTFSAFTCLPCLLCYWPLRAGVHCLNSCYAGGQRRGCQCRKASLTPLNSVVRLASLSPSSSPHTTTESSPVSSTRSLKDTPPPRPPKPGYAIRVNPQESFSHRSRDFR